MLKRDTAEFEDKVETIEKQIIAIEKERDLSLGKIRKRIEARQIKEIIDNLK